MATVKVLRELWRLRRYVAGVGVVAVLAGMLVAYQPSFPPKSRSYDIGTATAQVLVDTPQSQVVGDSSSVSAAGAQTLGVLGVQANLLSGLMVEGPTKTDIAQRAGLNPNQLIGVSSAVTVPSATGSASGPTTPSVPSGQNVYGLTTQILTDSDGQTTLPIIEISAQAPDQAKAVRLASAAVAGLQAFVSSEAASERIPDGNRLSIMSLGVSDVATQTVGSSPLTGVLVTLVVLLLGCGLLLWIRSMIRSWRRASERERLGLPLEDEPEWVPSEPASPVDPERGALVATNGLSQRHFATNGTSGKSNNGDFAPAADFPGSPGGDTSGQDSASPSRQWSSRRWSTGRADSGLDRRRPVALRLHRHHADPAEGKLIPLLADQPSGQASAEGNNSIVVQRADESHAIARDQSTVSRDQSTVSRDQSTVSRDQSTVSRDQSTVSRDQSTVSRDQASHGTP